MALRRLTIFSAAERRYCEPLLRGFAQDHPAVDIDFVFGISTDLHRRYLQEAAAGGATADLLWSSAMDQQMALVLEGHAQPHGVPLRLPAGMAYRDLAVATTCEPLFALSRDAGAPAGTPAEIASLLANDPNRFRGRIAVPDIETNGLGFLAMLCWALEDSMEDLGFDEFLDALALCRPRAVGSAPALIAAMSDGAELALHLLGSYARRAVAADPTLHIAPSAAPSLAVARIAFIPRRAANPEAASAFLAYMLSPKGQAAIGEAGLYPLTAKALGVFPSPNQTPACRGLVTFKLPEAGKPAAGWGGVRGGGPETVAPGLAHCTTPLPNPPPTQVGLARLARHKTRPGQARGAWGREHTEFAARADLVTPGPALAPIPLDERFSRLLDQKERASLLTRWRAALGRTQDQDQDQHRRKQA